MRLIGYARVSTEEQGAKGHSLGEQESLIRQYVENMSSRTELVEVIHEVGSAGDMNRRPKLLKILCKLDEKKADGIIIYDMTRLSRKLHDITTLLENYFHPAKGPPQSLFSVCEKLDLATPAGRMFLYQMGIIGQFMREQTIERARQTSARLKSQGKRYNAHPPFGMMVNQEDSSRLCVSPDEDKILERIKEMKEIGASLGDIAKALPLEGMFNRAGNPFTETAISKICRRHEWKSVITGG